MPDIRDVRVGDRIKFTATVRVGPGSVDDLVALTVQGTDFWLPLWGTEWEILPRPLPSKPHAVIFADVNHGRRVALHKATTTSDDEWVATDGEYYSSSELSSVEVIFNGVDE